MTKSMGLVLVWAAVIVVQVAVAVAVADNRFGIGSGGKSVLEMRHICVGEWQPQ